MIWRSVVGKLWLTILLLVSFVLFILTVLLLEFFENFHIEEAETDLMRTATKVSTMVDQYDDYELMAENAEIVKGPSSQIVVVRGDDTVWTSDSSDEELPVISTKWLQSDKDLAQVLNGSNNIKKQSGLPGSEAEVMIVGTPLSNQDGAVFVYQSLTAVKETTKETTKIIFLGAGIAIILTTIFAFFLSTRITSPLIKMRKGAFELAKGEFNTKVPILTHDEIGELAMAFNRMGRQLKFHINALRQEKEQLSGVLSSMADGVITLNRIGDIMVTNPPADKFIRDWYYENNITPEVDKMELPDDLKNALTEVIESESEVLREVSVQGRNWVMIMTPLYDQTHVRGAVAVIRDMTEERRLDKLREDFIANVSHELRTPISMLQGYSEAIVDNIAESNEEKNELAQIIYDESLRIGRLVNELLDLARMEAGHIQLNIENMDIAPFVERIVKKFRGISKDKNISIRLKTDQVKGSIALDPDRIEQVLTNLIDNAINHTNEKGEVIVAVDSTADYIRFAVQDFGLGIPQEDLPFVFERFYKADKSRKRQNGKAGTGLGLAIAKNIVDAHLGEISVQSKEHEGTIFTFKIPKKLEHS